MASLNQLASRIVNTINQPTNIELLERAKDFVRSAYAFKMKELISREGINSTLSTSFAINTIQADYAQYLLNGVIVPSTTSKVLISENLVPTVVAPNTDSPYQRVSTDAIVIPYVSGNLFKVAGLLNARSPVAPTRLHTIINGRLLIDDVSGRVKDTDTIYISGILEHPETILAHGKDPDNIDLPIPNSIIDEMLYSIYRINFNMYPKHIEVNLDNANQSK